MSRDPTASSSARAALERELYRVADPAKPSAQSTFDLRTSLHDFGLQMRRERLQVIPRGEPTLGAQYRWKRGIKYAMFRSARPVSRRYDRLLAELADLTASLADRVVLLEAEVARLRHDRDGSERDGD